MQDDQRIDYEQTNSKDQEVLSELLTLRADLNRYILTLIPNHIDAEDVFQEVCLKIWNMRDDYEHGTRFRSWAFTITRYTILDWRKRYATRRVHYLDNETVELLANQMEREVISSNKSSDVYKAALSKCLDSLNERVALLFKKHYTDRVTLVELAEQESMTSTALKQMFYRTRLKLRKCININIVE